MDKKAYEWLNENQLSYDIWNNKYRYNNETLDEWLDRVSGGDKSLRQLIYEQKFLFGGRALANRGTGKKGSMFNCYSSGYAPDDITGLMQLNTNLALTYKAQGGQGLSLTHVRPKGTSIGNEFKSDGIVPFMEIFNATTASISQGGARKGALMMSLDIMHKEAETFIKIKSNEDKITKANLSLEIDDRFMKAVKEYYETGKIVKIHETREYNGHKVEYDVIPIELYKLMIKTAYDWGEPACIFTNNFRSYNLMEYDDDYQIETCNPCLHPDTLIQTTEGLIKIKDMNKPMMVYCMDDENKLSIRKSSPSFITKHNTQTINLTINNGNILKVTPNHLIYIKNKGWIEAKDVVIGDNPIALLRSKRGAKYAGVRLSTCPKDAQVMEHRLVYEAHYGKIEDGYDIHHKDGDTYNNDYHNLEKLTHSEHATLTRYECDNNHQVRDEETGKFISSEYSKHGKKTIVDLPNDLKTNFDSTPRIISIEYGEKTDVYDITVDEFHNFIADGIIVHNCGEQPLPKNFSCNLGSLNVSEFVKNPYTKNSYFDWIEFKDAVKISVEALDNIIDENLNNHALKEQADNSKNYRNIGLGIMGYSNALFKLGLTYGSQEALCFTDTLFSNLFFIALNKSCDLAKEKGMFPKCKPEAIIKSKIFQKIYNNYFNDYDLLKFKTYGLRNCSLISVAPTGSIATMLGISGGCEPEFALSYTRKTHNLKDNYEVFCKSVNEYWDITDKTINKGNIKSLPEYFVTSAEIPWKNRIDTQAVMQKYVDTAISSTINLPKDISVEQIEQIYLYAWEQGLKGITIFRNGCKRDGILSTDETATKTKELNTTNKYHTTKLNTSTPITREELGYRLDGSTYVKRIACGKLYITINRDSEGNLVEVFIDSGKSGGCSANAECLGRFASAAMRNGMSIESIVDITKGVKCSACTNMKGKAKKIDGLSCGDVLARTIQEEYEYYNGNKNKEDKKENKKMEQQVESIYNNNKRICPDCGNDELSNEGGCVVCHNCGWSKCD